MLVYFLRHPDEVLSRTRIYEHVWDERYDGVSNTLEVHVKELRRKARIARRAADPYGARPGLSVRQFSRLDGPGIAMSLVTRLSASFLAALALILAVFSLSLCLLAAHHLERQLDERLAGTLMRLDAGVARRARRHGVEAARAAPDAGPGQLDRNRSLVDRRAAGR